VFLILVFSTSVTAATIFIASPAIDFLVGRDHLFWSIDIYINRRNGVYPFGSTPSTTRLP
jgi:hypothetical protein